MVCSILETLEKKEREAKQAAKQQAAKELALALTSPEDLNKVEQIRFPYSLSPIVDHSLNGFHRRLVNSDSKRILKAQLNALVKNKLDDVETGLSKLDTANEMLESLRQKYPFLTWDKKFVPH